MRSLRQFGRRVDELVAEGKLGITEREYLPCWSTVGEEAVARSIAASLF